MPGHAVAPTQRAFEISSLVNICRMEAGGRRTADGLNGDNKAQFCQGVKIPIFTVLLWHKKAVSCSVRLALPGSAAAGFLMHAESGNSLAADETVCCK